jgi:hypothetical protein
LRAPSSSITVSSLLLFLSSSIFTFTNYKYE